LLYAYLCAFKNTRNPLSWPSVVTTKTTEILDYTMVNLETYPEIYSFAPWTVHFVNICMKNQQMHQLFIQFSNLFKFQCFGITLPSSGSVPSAFWETLNRGAVDRILWMGVLCLVTLCVFRHFYVLSTGYTYVFQKMLLIIRTISVGCFYDGNGIGLLWARKIILFVSKRLWCHQDAVYISEWNILTICHTAYTYSYIPRPSAIHYVFAWHVLGDCSL
jgi:hypothetical protein